MREFYQVLTGTMEGGIAMNNEAQFTRVLRLLGFALFFLLSVIRVAQGLAQEPALLIPQPGPGNLVLPLFQKPFAGDFRLVNFFDHNLPFEFDTTPGIANGFQLTWWGERTFGIDGHSGYDWKLPEGTPILAAADGTVVFAGSLSPFFCPVLNTTTIGVRITIDHSELTGGQPRIRSRYFHMSRIDVTAGQHVKAGDVIGLSGNVGCSLGPHLHFEAQTLSPGTGQFTPIDPYGWEGPGADPWAEHPQGAESLWLWNDGQVPAIFREFRLAPNPSGSTAPVPLTAFRDMGWKDEDNPNNEFVELTLDTRFSVSNVMDLTGFSLRNNEGDVFNFPSGFLLHDGSPVKVFTGSGVNTDTELYWGQSRGMWDDIGDCARRLNPTGLLYFLRSAGTCGVVLSSDVAIGLTGPAGALVGHAVTYTATVTSNGPNDATGVVITYDLPDGVALASSSASQGLCFGTDTVVCNIGTVANGSSATVDISVIPTEPGTIVNTMTVEANEKDSNAANNTATVETTANLPVTFALTVSVTGVGSGGVTSNPSGINCGTACTANYEEGTLLTLTATPSGNSRFAGWSGGSCAGRDTCAITMSADKTATATFVTALVLSAPALPDAEVGESYSTALATEGVPPYTLILKTGTLPAGLSFSAADGTLGGAPTSSALKGKSFTAQISDQLGPPVTGAFKIKILAALKITTKSLKSGTHGKSYKGALKASGGKTPYSWSELTGNLTGTGLALDSSTGAITGTPLAAGMINLTLEVTDALGGRVQKGFTLTIK